MGLVVFLIAALALAEEPKLEHTLTWDLAVNGQKIGQRDVTVKYVSGELGMRRILESWTEIDGSVGPMRLVYRQRMTAHASQREPASFHSVMEQNGTPAEVQARWTASAWWVTTNIGGRARTVDMPANRIDISTADLFDPDTRFPIGRFEQVRVLSAETGDVFVGPVEDLGTKAIQCGDKKVQAKGYAWDAPMGKSTFWYSGEGFLVAYDMAILGVEVQGRLRDAPPPGVDDFPVAYGAPAIEEIPL